MMNEFRQCSTCGKNFTVFFTSMRKNCSPICSKKYAKLASKMYNNLPKAKAKRREYQQSFDAKAKAKEYYKRPENMVKKKAYRENPENKSKVAARQRSPECKARAKELRKLRINGIKQ